MPRLHLLRSLGFYHVPEFATRYQRPMNLHRRYQRTFSTWSSTFIALPQSDPIKSPAIQSFTSSLFSAAPERQGDRCGGGLERDHEPLNGRVVKLGKTLRILSPLLPTILINSLPAEILSPHVALHLFPSTHPHLPNIKGRVLYRAALWTVPVAWSSVPLVGNVRLQILSERMVRTGFAMGTEHEGSDCGDERLVVRWKTEAKNDNKSSSSSSSSLSGRNDESTITTTSSTSSTKTSRIPSPRSGGGRYGDNSGSRLSDPDQIDIPSGSSRSSLPKIGSNKSLSTLLGGEVPIFKPGKEGQFSGLFVFAFDEEGRIASHTIEHADQANGWDRTAKFVTLTDWLLGKARGSIDPSAAAPSLATESCDGSEWDSPIRKRSNK